MDNRQLLSIDFGSAYTKIAFRTSWNTESELLRDIPLAPKETTYCIPSIVARVTRGHKEEWLIGVDAASQLPGDGVKIYRDWKAGLLTGEEECVQVAKHFFRTLRSMLNGMRSFEEAITSHPVRVCVPSMGDANDLSPVIVQILEDSGWHLAPVKPTAYEPEANALGVLTRGRNATWIPAHVDFQPHKGRSVWLPSMLDPDLNNAFRQMRDHLWRASNRYRRIHHGLRLRPFRQRLQDR